MADLAQVVSIADMRALARRRLPRLVFDFIDGGAGAERTLRDNELAFERWRLMPRVGIDVRDRSMETGIVGYPAKLPLVLAPIGLTGLFSPKGELAAARAAHAAGVPFCLSTNSVASIEDVAGAVSKGERWFQLYMLKDRDLMNALLDRAERNGYRVLCITLDLAVQGRRERDMRNAFAIPVRPSLRGALDIGSRPRWLYGLARNPVRFGNFPGSAGEGLGSIAQFIAGLFDPGATWDDVARLRERWRGPVVMKGILHPADAAKAVELGAAAVIVSNHGGRQLDQVPAALEALPDVAEAVAGRAEIILDGGVRRGTDILKALALGATSCMIGRAFIWGLCAGGEAGVRRSLAILRDELDNAAALLGVNRLADVDRDHIRRAGL